MKIKIIKKILSVLLTISSLATATFFVSAENGDQHDLESKIAECDEIIEECNETILDFEKEKDRNIESIHNDLQALDQIKKILNTGEILECDLKDLESQNQDLLKKIEHIKENYQNSIKLACETKQQQINKKAELQKKLGKIEKKEKNSEQNIDDLIKKSEDLEIKFRTLSISNRNKLDRLSRVALISFPKKCKDIRNKLPLSKDEFNKLQAEFIDLKTKVDAICQNEKSPNEFKKKEKNSEQNIDDLIEKGETLEIKFRALSISNRNKLDRLSRVALISFPKKCKNIRNKLPLSKDEFNKLQAEFNDLKTKVDAICQNEKSPNEFENLQAKSGTSDQHQKSTKLWQKINSGAQYYKPNQVADNLCWLHSATNVRNYYNNMKNKGIVKGQTKVVKKYKQIMGDQAAANNINGSMKEFDSIAEYLQKCGLGSLQIIISNSSKSAEQKVKNTAKELLKAHFNKIQNTSPVIGHIGGSHGHFVTIADYDQNQDQFLIVDSSEDRSIEARVVWRESSEFLQALTKQGFFDEHTIELDFTSNIPGLRSVGLTLSDNDSIVQRDWTTENAEEIQTSINALKNMIEHY